MASHSSPSGADTSGADSAAADTSGDPAAADPARADGSAADPSAADSARPDSSAADSAAADSAGADTSDADSSGADTSRADGDTLGADGDTSFLESELTSEPAAPARRRRPPAWLLAAVAALGVGVLVGALLFGGSDTSAAAPPVATPIVADPARPHLVTALARSEPVQLDIPAIEVSSTLVDLGLNGDGTLEVPVDYAKAGWFAGGNFPGDPQGPPGLIAGHVDDFTGPAVFYRLDELAVGDEVMVTRADNTVAVFTVTASQQYAKDAFPAEEVYAPVGDSEIVLITCTGAFDQGARSYDDNLVVRATLDLERSLEESDARLAAGAPAPAGDQPNV